MPAKYAGYANCRALDVMSCRWELSRRDPIYFMRCMVVTLDQHDQLHPIKRWPWEKKHIQVITRLWQRHKLLTVLKSRQMMMTWLFVILALWDAMFHRGRLIMLQSKREEDAIGDATAGDGLLGRAKFIMDHMPYRELVCPDYEPLTNRIRFTNNNSTLWAIPQGASIIRQRTASGILSDESCFQPEFSDSYTAARPCIRGGGWYVALTTADLSDGGAFRALHEDTLDQM